MVPRPPFPSSLREFQARFATEEACADYLAACRWPEGFACPRCGHGRAYALVGRRRRQCASCRYQVSVTAGTVLHNSKTPLTTWFWAAYLMTTDKRGLSALLLQRQLGIGRYETAWMVLHKLRRAMVNAARSLSEARSRLTRRGLAERKLDFGAAVNSGDARPRWCSSPSSDVGVHRAACAWRSFRTSPARRYGTS